MPAAPLALLTDAASYLVSAWQLGRIAPVEPPAVARHEGHLTAGLRFIARSPVVRALLAAAATVNFFNFVFHTLVVTTRPVTTAPKTPPTAPAPTARPSVAALRPSRSTA